MNKLFIALMVVGVIGLVLLSTERTDAFVSLQGNSTVTWINVNIPVSSFGVTVAELQSVYPCVTDVSQTPRGNTRISFIKNETCYYEADELKNLLSYLDAERTKAKFLPLATRQPIRLNLNNGTTFTCSPEWIPQLNRWGVLC